MWRRVGQEACGDWPHLAAGWGEGFYSQPGLGAPRRQGASKQLAVTGAPTGHRVPPGASPRRRSLDASTAARDAPPGEADASGGVVDGEAGKSGGLSGEGGEGGQGHAAGQGAGGSALGQARPAPRLPQLPPARGAALRVQRATPRLRDVEPFAKPGARELTVLVMFSEAVRQLHERTYVRQMMRL